MDVKSTRIPTWHRMDHVSWWLGLFCKNHLLETYHRTGWPQHSKRSHRWFILFHHVWIEIHSNIILFWAQLVTYNFTLHLRVGDHTTWFWRCVGTAFGHLFFLALTISWSRLLARVWSGPKYAFAQSLVHIYNAVLWVETRGTRWLKPRPNY
jgi:hypothetical protein